MTGSPREGEGESDGDDGAIIAGKGLPLCIWLPIRSSYLTFTVTLGLLGGEKEKGPVVHERPEACGGACGRSAGGRG